MAESIPNYLPGMEPENVQNLLNEFFREIDAQFPDKIIIWPEWNHNRWDKAAGYLCKTLGYDRGKDFLEAYGYEVVQSRADVPTSVPHQEDLDKIWDVEQKPVFNNQKQAKSAKGSNYSIGETLPQPKPKKKKSGSFRVLGIIAACVVAFCVLSPHLFNPPTYDQPLSSVSKSEVQTSPNPQGNQSQYESEITFQDYQWGTNAVDIASRMGSQYFESMTPVWSDADDNMPISSYSLGYRIYNIGNQNIAGYDVLNFSMYCMYSVEDGKISTEAEDSELYLVTMDFNVADVEGTYDDLFAKLTALYGDASVSTRTGSVVSLSDGAYKTQITTAEWKGQNNTGVKLAKSVPEAGAPDSADGFNRYVVLSYGKTDSDETISTCYKAYREYQKEVEQAGRDSSNSSGL